MPITQEGFRERALSALPHSKQNAGNLRTLLTALADVLWEELGQPIAEYEHWPNPDKMTGRRLDDLGSCLGLPRPYIATGDYFAFHGAPGSTFSQAPFFSEVAGLQNRLPISDENYRPFLKWRFANNGGAPTYGEMRRGAFNLTEGFFGFDGGSISVTGNVITVSAGTIEGVQELLWNYLEGSQESLSRAMLPRVAGREYVFS